MNFRNIFTVLGLLACCSSAFASLQFKPEFYAFSATEAWVTYQGKVRMKGDVTPGSLRTEVMRQIYLIYYDIENTGSSPSRTLDVKLLSTTPLPDGRAEVTYDFKGKFSVPRNVGGDLSLRVVFEPREVFKKVVQNGVNLCGGKGVSEEDFWAEWSMKASGCPLQEDVDYETVSAHVAPIKNTVETYPEYQELLKSGAPLRAVYFSGSGHNFDQYEIKELIDLFKSLNFKVDHQWTRDELQAFVGPSGVPHDPVPNHIQVYDLVQTLRGNKFKVRLVFGNSSPFDGLHFNRAFNYFYKEALENAQLVAYMGHSGLGKNYNLARIEAEEGFKFKLSNQYQIFILDSCFPYLYYQEQFFNLKKSETDPTGTKGLDIITGDRSMSFGDDPGIVSFFSYIKTWMQQGKRATFQEIIRGMDAGVKNNEFFINGDEDNPTH